ncbi:hypothetical protein PIB30_016269 [Stylosanthes scabra]|uniref:RST domain-containing protein n=1 Tax=Stylosanthes scabra TaxID=79078 RepID=A0ABU6Z5M8_9FABA|nr:hypothetical protein [Stylosanthes scabra]
MPQWPTPSHENQPEVQNQEPETAHQREQPSSEMEQKQPGSRAEQVALVASQGVNNPPLPQHVASPANSPPLPQHVGSQNVNNPPLPQHVGSQIQIVDTPSLPQHAASQNVSNPALSQKQNQDEGHRAQPVQASLHNSQTVGIQNLGKLIDRLPPMSNQQYAKLQQHCSKLQQQCAKLQQMSNQQATVKVAANLSMPSCSEVPCSMLLPILLSQLPKDRAMQLQILYSKLKKDEIGKDTFVPLMKAIVGDQMLRMALSKVQSQLQGQTRPNCVENVDVVDGKRSNICASPPNMASKGVAVDKLCPQLNTMNIGGAFSPFTPPTSENPSFVGNGANLGFPPPPKMQKMVIGKGKQVETGVPVPNIKFDAYSNLFQAKGVGHNLEPPITSNSRTVLEGRVKELEIRLESMENERAAFEELKVTLTSKISDLENKLKEANTEMATQLRNERTTSRWIIEPLEAEVKHLRCSVDEAKEIAHRNIMEQVRLLAPGIDFSRVHPDHRVVNGEIVNPKKDSVPKLHMLWNLKLDVKTHNYEMLFPWPTEAKERAHGNIMEQE